jgi:hypothetical protein
VQLVLIYPELFALPVIQHVFHVQDRQQAVCNAHLANSSMVQNVINANATVSPAQVELLALPAK